MKRFQLFIRGISTNWTGTVGVALTTSAFLLFLCFELLRIVGILTNAYVGLISYMALPAVFMLGLVLVPLGWWQYRRATGRSTSELLTRRFPDDMTRPKRIGSSLLATFVLLTVINILFLGVGGARMLHFMDSPKFCGTACHQVMEPEWVAYQNSPHARVKCVECHVGEGPEALINAKLNGLWQVVSATFNLYERPIPTPVHQLRPARETCENCHWPEKFYGDRIKTYTRFASDEHSTARHTTLSLKIGSGTGEEAGTIHWHIAATNSVRYQARDEQRLVMDWAEVRKGDIYHRYRNRNPAIGPVSTYGEVRTMDCVDCHNRATHIYDDPAEAVDRALALNRVDTALPYARKVALKALTGHYGNTKQAGLQGIAAGVRGHYLRGGGAAAGMPRQVDQMVKALQDIYARNIFPFMNVGWNSYPTHLGHRAGAGCFRCHNRDMVDDQGQTIPYDCTLCHSILAMDSPMKFEFLLPVGKNDPDRKMHQYLRREYLGAQADEFADAPDTGQASPAP